MKQRNFIKVEWIIGILFVALSVTGCIDALTPQSTYQGYMTDAAGNPLNGTYAITFAWYHDSSGGTAFYEETDSVTISDGLFDTVVGPSAPTAGLAPEDLSRPMWVEVTVGNGVITETLTPRQRLYGAPYAFTLMPGTIISGTLDTIVYGAGGIDAVATFYNSHDGDGSNPALPALRVIGEKAIELGSPTSSTEGGIYSNPASSLSDIKLYSNDEVDIHLDDDAGGTGIFRVFNGANSVVYTVNESGDTWALGTKSATVMVDQEPRLVYAIESPEVWFEDFGSGSLQNGTAVIPIEASFAKTVNLNADYHVFLTPLGDCNGLFVANKTAAGFEVHELGGGTSNVSFDFRLVAKRAGYENLRLELNQTNLVGEDE